jgi:hypothetical protein
MEEDCKKIAFRVDPLGASVKRPERGGQGIFPLFIKDLRKGNRLGMAMIWMLVAPPVDKLL